MAFVIAGLGNPGPAYAGTRHNIGAMVVAELAAQLSLKLSRHKKAFAAVGEGHIGLPGSQKSVVLAIPLCYMNESGGPIKSILDFYDVPLENLIVVHDELDIDFAAIRLKLGGGDNGHNGLKSIKKSIGSGEYYRIRMGIGRPQGQQDPADFVLSQFSSSDRKVLPELISRGCEALETLVTTGLDLAQNKFNS
ncbi:MAG: aminoacyl-tRNA hydrolase [Candidatus Nanopelagicales bacterium]|nr:aminoacyl-tRNA hydrolase [Candidatus Nanopelagicales bacterium]